MSRHTITHAAQVYRGDAYYSAYSPDGRRGWEMPKLQTVEFGAVDTLDADGICVDVSAAGAATLSATGALVSGGVATFDVARGVSITSTGNESSRTFTVTGTDQYGETLVEDIAGPNNTTANGVKAFKTVTSVAIDGATTSSAVDVGTSKVLGLPFRLADKGKVLGMFVDGVPESTLTVVDGFSASGTSTATTADVRGTLTPNTAPNGSKYMTAVMIINDDSSKTGLFGAAQFGG